MKFKPKYVAAVSCIIIMVMIASTAGCTSSSTSSNQQANKAGSDPDPALVPVYSPSQRTGYEHIEGSAASTYYYVTDDSVSQVTSFYKTQMPKLGYTLNTTQNYTIGNESIHTSYEKINEKTWVSITVGRSELLNATNTTITILTVTDKNR